MVRSVGIAQGLIERFLLAVRVRTCNRACYRACKCVRSFSNPHPSSVNVKYDAACPHNLCAVFSSAEMPTIKKDREITCVRSYAFSACIQRHVHGFMCRLS